MREAKAIVDDCQGARELLPAAGIFHAIAGQAEAVAAKEVTETQSIDLRSREVTDAHLYFALRRGETVDDLRFFVPAKCEGLAAERHAGDGDEHGPPRWGR